MTTYFKPAILTKKCQFPITILSSNLSDNIHKYIKNEFEGKCSNEGYIKTDSIVIINYSMGIINEEYVYYDITFQADICYPVEGQVITCTIQNITKAGIKAVVQKDNNPIVIFAARDLHLNNSDYHSLNIDDVINVKIIGVRFEIYDKYVSAIAVLINKL